MIFRVDKKLSHYQIIKKSY